MTLEVCRDYGVIGRAVRVGPTPLARFEPPPPPLPMVHQLVICNGGFPPSLATAQGLGLRTRTTSRSSETPGLAFVMRHCGSGSGSVRR